MHYKPHLLQFCYEIITNPLEFTDSRLKKWNQLKKTEPVQSQLVDTKQLSKDRQVNNR